MTKTVRFATVLILLAGCSVLLERSSCQGPEAASVIKRIMSSALSRCFSESDGIKFVTFVPATNEEVAEVKALGDAAIGPLAGYLDAKPNDGFTQLFAVRFLMELHSPDTFPALVKALGHEQWEVTREVALNAMFALSKKDARPYVKSALSDESNAVRHSAAQLWGLYTPDDN